LVIFFVFEAFLMVLAATFLPLLTVYYCLIFAFFGVAAFAIFLVFFGIIATIFDFGGLVFGGLVFGGLAFDGLASTLIVVAGVGAISTVDVAINVLNLGLDYYLTGVEVGLT
jgi:hypothetical protein